MLKNNYLSIESRDKIIQGSVSKVGDYAKIWDNLKRKKALSLTPLS